MSSVVRSDFREFTVNTTNSAVDLMEDFRNDCLRPVSWKDKKELVDTYSQSRHTTLSGKKLLTMTIYYTLHT